MNTTKVSHACYRQKVKNSDLPPLARVEEEAVKSGEDVVQRPNQPVMVKPDHAVLSKDGISSGFLYPARSGQVLSYGDDTYLAFSPDFEDWHIRYHEDVRRWSFNYDNVPEFACLKGWTRAEFALDGSAIRIRTIDGYRIDDDHYGTFRIAKLRRRFHAHIRRTLYRAIVERCSETGIPRPSTVPFSDPLSSGKPWRKTTKKVKRSHKRTRRAAKEASGLYSDVYYDQGLAENFFNSFTPDELKARIGRKVLDTFMPPSPTELVEAKQYLERMRTKYPRVLVDAKISSKRNEVERLCEFAVVTVAAYRDCWEPCYDDPTKKRFVRARFIRECVRTLHYFGGTVCGLMRSLIEHVAGCFETDFRLDLDPFEDWDEIEPIDEYMARMAARSEPEPSVRSDMPKTHSAKEREFVAPLFFLSCLPFLRLTGQDETKTWFANAVYNYSAMGGASDMRNVLENVLEWIKWLVTTGAEAWQKKDVSVFFSQESTYLEWYTKSTELIGQLPTIGMEGPRSHVTEFLAAVQVQIDIGKRMMDLAIATKSSAHGSISKILEKLYSIINNERIRALARGPRPEPDTMSLVGSAGIGKTFLIRMLSAAACHIHGIDFTDATVFQRNVTDKFWSDFTPAARVFIYDDLGAVHPTVDPTSSSAIYQELMQVVGVEPYSPNMAGLDDKGKMLIRPILVIVTSNTPQLITTGLVTTPPALFRRFKWRISLTVLDRYRHIDPHRTNHGKPVYLPSFDEDRLDEHGRRHGIHKITVTKYINDTGDPNSKEAVTTYKPVTCPTFGRMVDVDTATFIGWFVKHTKDHKAASDRTNAAREGIANTVYCGECDSPVQFCICNRAKGSEKVLGEFSNYDSPADQEDMTDCESANESTDSEADRALNDYLISTFSGSKRAVLEKRVKESYAKTELEKRVQDAFDKSDLKNGVKYNSPSDEEFYGYTDQAWFSKGTSARAWKFRTKAQKRFRSFRNGILAMQFRAYMGSAIGPLSDFSRTLAQGWGTWLGSFATMLVLHRTLRVVRPTITATAPGQPKGVPITELPDSSKAKPEAKSSNAFVRVPAGTPAASKTAVESKAVQMSEGDPLAEELKAMVRRKPRPMYEPYEGTDSRLVLEDSHKGVSPKVLASKVANNTYRVEVLDVGTHVLTGNWGVFITPYMLQTVGHALFKGEVALEGRLRLSAENGWSCTYELSDLEIRHDFLRDIAFIHFPESLIRAHATLLPYVPVVHKPEHNVPYTGFYLFKRYDKVTGKVGEAFAAPVTGCMVNGYYKDEMPGRVSRERFHSTTADYGFGSCGAVSIFIEGSSAYIGSIQQAGLLMEHSNAGTFLTQSLLYIVPSAAILTTKPALDKSVKGLGPTKDVKWVSNPPAHAYHLHHELPAHIEHVGTIEHSDGSTKSRFYTTPLCDTITRLPRNIFSKPDFKIYTNRSVDPPEYHCHLTKAMNQMANTGTFTIKELEPAYKEVLRMTVAAYDRIVPKNKLTVLDMDIALNGLAEVPFFKGVKAATSMGLPCKGSKDHFIPQDEMTGKRSFTAPALAKFKQFVRKLGAGNPPPVLISMSLKDCKTKNDKVRMFACVPFFYNLVVKILISSLLNLMHMNPELFGNAVGMNARSWQWGMISDDLKKRLHQLCMDYESFDKSACFAANYWVWRIIIHLFERYHDLSERLFGVPVLNLLYECARVGLNPLYVFRGVVYLVRGSNPSGNAWTVDWNYFLNLLYITAVYLSCKESEGIPMESVLTWWIYGDDNNMGTDVEWFNLEVIVEYLGKRNVRVTMADKGSAVTRFQNVEDQTFLKRRFAFWGGVMHAPLSMTSIAAMVNCAMRSDSKIQRALEIDNIKGALVELSEYEPTDDILALEAEIIEMANAHYGKRVKFPRRPDILAVYAGNYVKGAKLVPCDTETIQNLREPCAVTKVDMDAFNSFKASLPSVEDQKRKLESRHTVVGVLKDFENQTDRTETQKTEAKNGAILIQSSSGTDPERSIAPAVEGVVVQPEVTQVETVAPVATIEMQHSSIETELAPAPTDAGLESYLSRPILVKEMSWDGDINLHFDPWATYLNNPRVRNKLQGYKFLRGNMHLLIQTNGTPFHAGRLLVSYEPRRGVAHSNNGDYRQHSTQPCALIDPMKSNVVQLDCPFISPDLWMDLTSVNGAAIGVVHVDTVCSLFMANSAVNTPVNINITGWLTDVELAMPTTVDMAAFDYQSDEYSTSPNTGVISGPATALASIAGALANTPIIGRFARATEIGASSIAGIASLFGFSRPSILGAPADMRPQFYGRMATTDTPDSALKLAVTSKQEVSIDPHIVGMGESSDEMVISDLVSKMCIIHTHTIPHSYPSGTVVFDHAIGPRFGEVTTPVTRGVAYDMTPMGWLSYMFRYWSGTITVKVTVVASAYHRGRLRVAWLPDDTEPVTTEYNSLYSQIIDLSGAREYTFPIAFCSSDGWLDMYSTNGRLVCTVVNEIVAPITPSEVCLIVSVAGGPDFEFAVADDKYISLSNYAPQADGDYTIVEESVTVDFFEGGKGPGRNLAYVGETVASLRPLLKRYAKYTLLGVPSAPGDQHAQRVRMQLTHYPQPRGFAPYGSWTTTAASTPSSTKINAVHTTPLTYINPCFHARKGGVRYMVKIMNDSQNYMSDLTMGRGPFQGILDRHIYVENNDTWYWATDVVGARAGKFVGPVGKNDDWDAYDFAAGAQAFATNQGLALNVESPYYSTKRFHLTLGERLAAVSVVIPESFPSLRGGYTLTRYDRPTGAASAVQPILQVYTAAAEDFTFNFWTGVPRMYNYDMLESDLLEAVYN